MRCDQQTIARERPWREAAERARVLVVVEYVSGEAVLAEPDCLLGEHGGLCVGGRKLFSIFGRVDFDNGLKGPWGDLVLAEQVHLVDTLNSEEVWKVVGTDAHVPRCEENHVVEVREPVRVRRKLDEEPPFMCTSVLP